MNNDRERRDTNQNGYRGLGVSVSTKERDSTVTVGQRLVRKEDTVIGEKRIKKDRKRIY